VLFGAGCGGTETASRAVPSAGAAPTVPESPNRVLQAALIRSAALTRVPHTAQTSISVTLTGLGADASSTGAFDIAGSGVVDLVRGDAELRVSIPRIDRLSRGGAAIEQRIVGGVVYTKLPADVLLANGLAPSVRWLAFDPRRAPSGDLSALAQSQVDPAGLLVFVTGISDAIRTIGSEPVRGVATAHYATTIDLGNLAGGRAASSTLRTRLAPFGPNAGGRRLGLDLWLDRAGRVRRTVVSLPLSSRAGAAALGPDAMLRIQGDFYGFGTRVRVSAPPAAQVSPYSTLRLAAEHR